MPKFLKYPLIFVYIVFRVLTRGQARWEVVVNLAGVMPRPSRVVHGGKVKLLHLRERFGDTWNNFNLAYFVSSGLPFAPDLWLKIYKFFGIKTVWNQNGLAYPAWAGRDTGRINNLMESIHQADYVIYQTEFTRRCSDKFLGRYQGESEILINPVDTKKFIPRLDSLEGPFTVIMSGHHFESPERLKISLEAFREFRKLVPDAKLLVIGNTQELPRESWLEVIGRFTQEEAPKLYHQGHALLHLKNLDPCPTFVLEAISAGLPVIGLGNGGMSELVNAGSGILIPAPEDFDQFHYPAPAEVAEAIIKVRANLAEFSRQAREQALKFDKEIWLKRHEEIFNKLCRKSQ